MYTYTTYTYTYIYIYVNTYILNVIVIKFVICYNFKLYLT